MVSEAFSGVLRNQDLEAVGRFCGRRGPGAWRVAVRGDKQQACSWRFGRWGRGKSRGQRETERFDVTESRVAVSRREIGALARQRRDPWVQWWRLTGERMFGELAMG
ncbi:hypothetical protein MKX07_001607 [Trichoderma sp. CBMAI-0711]|nr:hypothetical protein MKX07_001607 [Trichoderma sp. CBMAI-0711]